MINSVQRNNSLDIFFLTHIALQRHLMRPIRLQNSCPPPKLHWSPEFLVQTANCTANGAN